MFNQFIGFIIYGVYKLNFLLDGVKQGAKVQNVHTEPNVKIKKKFCI